MTFFELEQENIRLKNWIKRAIELPGLSFEMQLEAKQFLAPPSLDNKFGGNQKWEGEACNNRGCNHSSNSHAGSGKTHCSVVDCSCMKFEPSGRPNTSGR